MRVRECVEHSKSYLHTCSSRDYSGQLQRAWTCSRPRPLAYMTSTSWYILKNEDNLLIKIRGIELRILSSRDLFNLKDGAAIFSAGGGGSPEAGKRIVSRLVSDGFEVRLAAPDEVPKSAKVVNFACVGATTAIGYDSDAAVKTLRALEEYIDFSAYAIIPVELGGFNTLVAIDVAARCGIPVVDADGAGRSVPEVHLKVYTIDRIPLTPMVVSDTYAKNMVIVKNAINSRACERITRLLAAEWNHSAYTARRVLTGAQLRTSPIQLSLTKSMRVGNLLRRTANPIGAVLEETGGIRLFEGSVDYVNRKTRSGFTFVDVKIHGTGRDSGKLFELRAKNEVLVAYKDGKVVALAPDIITPVHSGKGNCVTAEKINEGNKITVLGLPAPQKWKTPRGLKLWKDVLRQTGIMEIYMSIEQLSKT